MPAQHSPVVVRVLNQFLRVLCRSLPVYLEDAKPWTDGKHAPIHAALAHLVADQQMFAGRVAKAIVAYGGQPEPGPFPMGFTALNDVALDYLFGQVIERLRSDIEALQHSMTELLDAPQARELAEEVLGNAQGHLNILTGLQG